MSHSPLLNHILEGKEYGPILKSPDVALHRTEWRSLFKRLIICPPKDRTIADNFHTQWHVSHHYIRQLIDDDALLMDMLWVWLPRYNGPSVELYRGENIDRLENGMVGTAWTSREGMASTFAGGLNAVGKGGVILQTLAPASSIIAGPSKHSIYLGEYEFTLDTRKLDEIVRIRDFSPCNLLLDQSHE